MGAPGVLAAELDPLAAEADDAGVIGQPLHAPARLPGGVHTTRDLDRLPDPGDWQRRRAGVTAPLATSLARSVTSEA